MNFPEDIENLKNQVIRAIDPICSAVDNKTEAEKSFLFTAKRTDAGRTLPPYYICYFIFVELLGFKNIGQFEKVAWSVPIDFKGVAYLLEHRKMGMGLFASNPEEQEDDCKEIVRLIHKAAKQSRGYFEWLAAEAAKRSDLNVLNHSLRLHERFEYFLEQFRSKAAEGKSKRDERIVTEYPNGGKGISFPFYELNRHAEWLAISAIDAFFSFTEHIFVQAAILKGAVNTGEEVANLADSEWSAKFKVCLDVSDPNLKGVYDKLVIVRRQIRNYMAHGAFGKNGEAFQMHSGAGAVPLLMPHQKSGPIFSIAGQTSIDGAEALAEIEKFMNLYWDSNDYPEVIYIKSGLPTILTYAKDGTYSRAMHSVEEMEEYVDHLIAMHDQSTNMDW